MLNQYIPPYDITEEMLELVSEIMEDIGKLSPIQEIEILPNLRRVNRINTIHSTLAIENNTLSLEKVKAIIDGKKVMGPKEDILAVQNANRAYEELNKIDPYERMDLLKIHEIMMKDLIFESGVIRRGNAGVFNEFGEVIHLAPPANLVFEQLNSVFDWVKSSSLNMLIKSSIFHYEFEFIHPFIDGNGRMGRFWQTAVLANWKPLFAWLPMESIIKENQEEYYKAIETSTNECKSNRFIIFMLTCIKKAMNEMVIDTTNHYRHITKQVSSLIDVMSNYPESTMELMTKLKLKSRLGFRNNYINPALKLGLIAMSEPDKPTSKNQRYYKII